MTKLNLEEVSCYIEQNIGEFHAKRIHSLDDLELSKILKRKNPYLFKAKHVLTAEQIVRGFVDAHISSQEETIFGDWLEGFAIFINKKVYGGWKSSAGSIDLEFDNEGTRFIVNIKSGPNWGNFSQIAKMKADFITAKRTLRTGNSKLNIVAVNGCCYGRESKPDKGDYYKYCGQEFWKFISGDDSLYLKLIEPLGHRAKQKNDEFNQSYSQMINKFTREFANIFCMNNGEIDWDKLIKFNSAKDSIPYQ